LCPSRANPIRYGHDSKPLLNEFRENLHLPATLRFFDGVMSGITNGLREATIISALAGGPLVPFERQARGETAGAALKRPRNISIALQIKNQTGSSSADHDPQQTDSCDSRAIDSAIPPSESSASLQENESACGLRDSDILAAIAGGLHMHANDRIAVTALMEAKTFELRDTAARAQAEALAAGRQREAVSWAARLRSMDQRIEKFGLQRREIPKEVLDRARNVMYRAGSQG